MAKRGEIKLGDTVKDKITGVTGVVVSVTAWLNGCETVQVQQRELDKDGKPHERLALDVEQVDVVASVPRVNEGLQKTGGDAQRVRSGRE